MQTAIKCVLKKYATFTGRAERPEFWWFMLFLALLNLALAIIEGAILAPMLGFEAFAPEAGQPLRMLSSLVFLLPSLAVTVRRLHDINRSGWWYLIVLVPIIGICVLVYWFAQRSHAGENQYG
ncbi:MAG: DUF805 domain-containing protein [Halioglobus sp.]